MSGNSNKPPADTNEMVKQFQDSMKGLQAKQQAAAAKNPNYSYLPESYASRCKAWAKRDLWTLGEAANLLAGTDPNRPKIEGHDKLNSRVNTISEWLRLSAVRKEGGVLSKRYVAKEVITWALEKEIPVPDALLIAMGHKPKVKMTTQSDEQAVHGNVIQNAKKREKVLGAAVSALIEYPAQCKGRGGKYTGASIAKFLEQRQDIFFEGNVTPYAQQTMADIINGYLKVTKNKNK